MPATRPQGARPQARAAAPVPRRRQAERCCARFKPKGWDEQRLHFKDKRFVRATTRSIFHIPLNMGSVFPRTYKAIEAAKAACGVP